MRPFAEVLESAASALRARSDAELHTRQMQRANHAAAASVRALRETMDARGIPPAPDLRRVLYGNTVALTDPVRDVIRGLSWRRAQALPTGERPALLLVLQGPRGCGKTLAAALAVGLSPSNALFLPAQTLGAVPDSDWSTHAEARARWETVPVLALDDVGTERDTGRAASRCGPLLLARYNAALVTIITTNVDPAAFAERYFQVDGDGGGASTQALSDRLRNLQSARGCPYWCRYAPRTSLRAPGAEEYLRELPRVSVEASR